MVDKSQGEGSKKPCCKDDTKEPQLVKATELPIYGNPNPPKDIILEDRPGILETKVAAVRVMMQPIVSPLLLAYEKASDIVDIGVAHSQTSFQRLVENQATLPKATFIAGAGVLGFVLARRRGFFKRILFTSVLFGGAAAACYPNEAWERSQVAWYIAKNKLPVLAMHQYEKIINSGKVEQPVADEDPLKSET